MLGAVRPKPDWALGYGVCRLGQDKRLARINRIFESNFKVREMMLML